MALPTDLFLVVGKDDFTSDDEGSLILCRSCFDKDQDGRLVHLEATTIALPTKAQFWGPVECEGHRCCLTHPECNETREDRKAWGRDQCHRERIYDERRGRTREKLERIVLNGRLGRLESQVATIFTLLAWGGAALLWKNFKSDFESLLGPTVGSGVYLLLAWIAVTLVTRFYVVGTIRKKIRLPR